MLCHIISTKVEIALNIENIKILADSDNLYELWRKSSIPLNRTMNRKDFIKGSCGVCIALSSGFVMNALMSSCKTPLGVIKASSKDNMLYIALKEFESGDYKLVRVNNYDYDLSIQKEKDGSYTTLVLKCSHAGHPVTKTGNTYYCTLHGSQFSHEGKVLKGPASVDMTKLKTVIDKDQLIIHLQAV